MKQYDDRINTYKKIAGFKPEQITSDEAAKANAAVEARFSGEKEAAVAALTGKAKPNSDEPEQGFLPFNFEDAPVFKSVPQEGGQSEQTKKQDAPAQEKAPVSLPSLPKPPKAAELAKREEGASSDIPAQDSAQKPPLNPAPAKKPVRDARMAGYQPVPYTPNAESFPRLDTGEKNQSAPDVQSSAPPVRDASSPDYKPVPYVPQGEAKGAPDAPQQSAPKNPALAAAFAARQMRAQANEPKAAPAAKDVPARQGAQATPEQAPTQTAKVQTAQVAPQPQPAATQQQSPYVNTAPYAGQIPQFAAQAQNVAPKRPRRSAVAQALNILFGKDGREEPQSTVITNAQAQSGGEPVREIIPPARSEPQNQFDMAAFAALSQNSQFKPKTFSAQPLETFYKKPEPARPKAAPKPAAAQPKKPITSEDVLYKMPAKEGQESGARRVAKFLLLIGVDEAAKVIALLPSEQVEKIIPEIASVRSVSQEESEEILAEFNHLIEQARESGGASTARTILEKAFGEESANQLMQKVVPFENGKPFEYLKDVDGDQLSFILKDESTPVRALVLTQVKPAVAAAVINKMSDEERKDTVLRLSKLTKFPPDILGRIDRTMRRKVESLKAPSGEAIDGRGALASILRKMEPNAEKNVLENLSYYDPELESDLRKRLFTVDDIVNAEDRFIQKKLNDMEDKAIATLICGKAPEFRKKILNNISKSRGINVLGDEEALAPIPRKESERVTNEFIAMLRRAWEEGDLVVNQRNDGEWV